MERGYTWSEEWRRICEARYLLRNFTLTERRALLPEIEAKRGKKAADELKAELIVQHRELKQLADDARQQAMALIRPKREVA